MLAWAAGQQSSQGRPIFIVLWEGLLVLALQSDAVTRNVLWLARRMASSAVMRAFSF